MKNKNTLMPQNETTAKVDLLKIGIDIHGDRYVIVCQQDARPMQAAQQFSPDGFFAWIGKQRARAHRVVTCYEAGCFGYVAHRRLEAMGIENLVVRPRDWDEYGQRTKTDARDARELCGCLDRYLAGNTRALTVVRVPTRQQERDRSFSRQREFLEKERKRLQNFGTSTGRFYGVAIAASWWKEFEQLRESLDAFLVQLLEPVARVLQEIYRQLREATAREERTAARMLPTGLGALSASILDREIGDYGRFKNRREVASYTGLCPGEHSSGSKRRQGSVTKAGNPRIRHILLEAVWRMFYFQPNYRPIVYWKERMAGMKKLTSTMKKKIAVAIARQFMIDWWRIQTGRMKPEAVGLQVSFPAAYAARAMREGRISKTYAC